jgi:ElaB/YqjD/DUF883 family membrane-anchored ribosome-binding protein
MNPTASKFAIDSANVAPHIHQASDGLLQSAGNAIETTREFANDKLDKAEDKVRTIRENIDPVVDMLTAKAQKMARQSLDMAAQARDRAQQSLTRATDVTTRYVSEQPLRSVLIAAGVGAMVALLISATRNRNQH